MKAKRESRLTGVFTGLKDKGEKALITFITAGDPDMKRTKDIIFELEKAGADIIELGIPFSDPMADGPTIQASSERALKKGATISSILSLVKDIRKLSDIPIVLFGYYNPLFTYGLKRFARSARLAAVDGVLVVDLPPEEAGELERELHREGIDLIYLLTPTSDSKRMKLVSAKGSGFIYYVSVTGVTGARKRLAKRIAWSVNKVRTFTDLPVGVGFGISTPEQARRVAQRADGVVVGSAIINVIEKYANKKDLVKRVGRFAAAMKNGMRSS
jgi:tryptophan synthase alpha chain